MSEYRRNFFNGTHGTTANVTNMGLNGSGDTVQTTTGGTRQYDNTVAGARHSGTECLKVYAANGSQATMGWNDSTSSYTAWGKTLAFRGYFYFDTLPTTGTQFLQFRASSAEATNACAFAVTELGRLSYATPGGTVLFGSNGDISATTLYRIEAVLRIGTTTSNSELDFAIYAGDSDTPIRTVNATGLNCGTNNISGMRWGKLGNTGDWTWHGDDFAIWEGHNAFLGPSEGDPAYASSTERITRYDFTSAVGAVELDHTSGTAVTIDEVETGLFEVTAAAHADPIVLTYTITADGPPITGDLVMAPDHLHHELVYVDDEWI